MSNHKLNKPRLYTGLQQLKQIVGTVADPFIAETFDVLYSLVNSYEEIHGAVTIPQHELMYIDENEVMNHAKQVLAEELAKHLLENSYFTITESTYVLDGKQLMASMEILKPSDSRPAQEIKGNL